MNYTIDKAKFEDAIEINNLLTDLIQDERIKYNSNINENYKVENFYDKYINNEDVCILVAKDKDTILGYVYGFIQDNGNLFNKSIAQMDALFVKEKYRGNGIAKKLIDNFIKWSHRKGASYAELSVCKDNIDALNLYKKEGFEVDKLYLRKVL